MLVTKIMVNVHQLILSLPWIWGQTHLQDDHRIDNVQSQSTDAVQKSIAIIGAGSSGLSSLKTFLDVAESKEQDWELVVFERREDVGGVWYNLTHYIIVSRM